VGVGGGGGWGGVGGGAVGWVGVGVGGGGGRRHSNRSLQKKDRGRLESFDFFRAGADFR